MKMPNTERAVGIDCSCAMKRLTADHQADQRWRNGEHWAKGNSYMIIRLWWPYHEVRKMQQNSSLLNISLVSYLSKVFKQV
jgi:hypothetical protein